MALYLEIKNGPLLGDLFKIQEGVFLGRTSGDIIIPDQKMSNIHAQIALTEEGSFILMDKNSSNGIWANKVQVKSLALTPGITFRLGLTEFLVIEKNGPVKVSSRAKLRKAPRAEWIETLSGQVGKLIAQDNPKSGAISAFNSILELNFIAGPQADNLVTLGYGPRKFGSDSLDIELTDPLAPFHAFEIISDKGHPQLITNQSKEIRLNMKNVSSVFLNDGDIISFGDTQIRVSFLK